jgi:hypothetical protein
VLHLAEMRWDQPEVKGESPGPCNMHTADYIPARRQLFVFRGGDGREYLNDMPVGMNIFIESRVYC